MDRWGTLFMRKRSIFARRKQTGQGRRLAIAIVLLLGLAVWAGTREDPNLPPIYLKAAPIDSQLGRE